MVGRSVPGHNIVLTGFMGSGKSAVGRALAAALQRRFVDTDDVIEQQHGPVPTIFAEHGEATFRAHERALAEELADQTGLVVSTGGGMLVDPSVADRLEASGRVFCLVAAPATIIERVRSDGLDGRPLLDADDAEASIADLLASRAEAYGRFEMVPTDDRSVADIVTDIVERLRAT